MSGLSGTIKARLSPSVRLFAAVRVECQKQTPFPLFFLFFFGFLFDGGSFFRQKWVDAVGCLSSIVQGAVTPGSHPSTLVRSPPAWCLLV
jgi:hypothetical protein